MTSLDIAHQRLHNQHISGTPFERPEDVVGWLGAVQAQDYAGAKWAVAQRAHGITDTDMDQALADGTILRTHVMRPTWHFVAPVDIRWMLSLTAPHVNALNAYSYRQLGLDDAVFAKSNAVLAKALQGGKQLTRAEVASALQEAGIATNTHNLLHIMGRAELDGIICSGALRGKQHSYALLDERAPQAKTLMRNEALAELAKRYFTSHGPATLKDYIWWSGLAAADVRAGLEMVKSQLMHEVVDGQTYWFAASVPPAKDISQTAYLLPNYDEYIVGYKDRSAVFDTSHPKKLNPRDNVVFNHTIVIGGQIAGTWKRTFKKNTVVIEANPFTSLNKAETHALTTAAERYGTFVNMPVLLS